jgi:hypothetical protein
MIIGYKIMLELDVLGRDGPSLFVVEPGLIDVGRPTWKYS